jgi:hypothetical protein
MSRKHYVEVARAIASQVDKRALHNQPDALNALEDVADAIAIVFSEDNPRFDYAKFRTACGFIN